MHQKIHTLDCVVMGTVQSANKLTTETFGQKQKLFGTITFLL